MSDQIHAEARSIVCAACRTPCAFQSDPAAHATPTLSCPLVPPAWHAWKPGSAGVPAGSSSAITEPKLATPRPLKIPLLRRVRAYRRAGRPLVFVDPATRHARQAVCVTCPAVIPTEYRGLYRCHVKSCHCGGGDELYLANPKTICDKWRLQSKRAPVIEKAL